MQGQQGAVPPKARTLPKTAISIKSTETTAGILSLYRWETFMNSVEKALWFIESHFASEITLEEIANAAGVSRFHMTRAFGIATGHSIMRYVRGRRLTEAAKALSLGAQDILAVALNVGYGSHEALPAHSAMNSG